MNHPTAKAPTLAQAHAQSNRLTGRDHHILTLLSLHRALTAAQLARLVFPSEHAARQRLYLLAHRDVLARFRDQPEIGSAPWIYTLGIHGAAIRAAAGGRPLPKPADISARILRLQHSPHRQHLLGINDFFTRLAHEGRTTPGAALTQWWPEATTANACAGLVRPDGYGRWTHHGDTVCFYLEHDRGSETQLTLLRKIDKYEQLARVHDHPPTVLVELPTTSRETHFHHALHHHYGRQGPPRVQLATTHRDHPAADHPAGPLWRVAHAVESNTHQRYRLIELSRPPLRAPRAAS